MAFVQKEDLTGVRAIWQQQEKLHKWCKRCKSVDPILLATFFNVQQKMKTEKKEEEIEEEEQQEDVLLTKFNIVCTLAFSFW